jgi:hypothetical protein
MGSGFPPCTAPCPRSTTPGPRAEHILADSALVQNDIDEYLLGLFCPWQKLTAFLHNTPWTRRVLLYLEQGPTDPCALLAAFGQKYVLSPEEQGTSFRRPSRSALEMDELEENCTGAPAGVLYGVRGV